MAFYSGFFNSKGLDRTYTAEDFTSYLSSIICNGILDTYGQNFKLTAARSGLKVNLGTGKAWIDGHYFINDARYSIDLTSYRDESLPRYVAIAILLDVGESVRSVSLEITPGTPTENPSLPSLPSDENKTRLLMYAVRLNPGATELTERDWYDYREDKNVCGYCKCILGKCRVTELIHTAITTVMDAISNVISTVWNAISGFISDVVNAIWSVISSIWNSIKDHITNTLNAIHAVVSAVWNAISGFISGVLNTISSVVSSIWNAIKNTVSTVMNAIKTTVSNIWDSVKNAVTQKITAIKDTIVNGFNAAVSFIKNLASQAFQWGADIINGIVNGIKNCIGKVADAVKGVANKIKSFLHFSVPDEGPLADFESWMPDFMQGLADGINANTSVVNDAVNSFAGGLAEKISSVIQSALSNVVTSVQGFMTQVFDTVKTVWTNANAAIDATMLQIRSGITSGWKTIVSTIKTAPENIRNVITTTWKAVSSVISAALDGIKKIVTAVWTALKNLIKTGQLDIKSVVTSTWEAVSGLVRTAVNAIKSVVQAVWDAMPDTVRSAMNRVKEAVLSIWDGIKSGIGDRLGGVRDAVTGAMNSVYQAVMEKVNSSWSWGRDLMQNLINGLNYMLGSLINTVADVARSIWEYLHFSVPEKGALTDVEEWMPDFMKGLAKGINKSKKYVEAAVSGVADAMTLTMQSGLNVDMDGRGAPAGDYGAMMNAGSGGVVNNYYNNDNSRTVNQTNNSPKSLSRLEIYRMTRNALNV